MHIWYINPYSGGPGIGQAFRPFNLARAWQRQGHSVHVIMAQYHHLLYDNLSLPAQLTVEGVVYHCLPARHYQGNGRSRVLNMWDFCRSVSKLETQAPGNIEQPDAIIASSPHPFTVIPAARLARKFGAKLVFEIRDLWPLSITEITGTSRWHPFVAMCAFAERFAYRNADLISSVLPRADHYLRDVGVTDKPFVWVPNGVELLTGERPLVSSETAKRIVEAIAEWKREGRVIAIHAGSMGPPNGLLELLDAVMTPGGREMADRFGIIFVGSGTLEDQIRRRAQQAPGNVRVFGRVDKAELLAILAEVDIAYCGLTDKPQLYKYGVSLNKFGDYLLAGLPSLLPIAACGDPISESGAGIATGARTPEELWTAFHRLITTSDNERTEMGSKGRAYFEQEYDMAQIASRYIAAINGLSG